VYLAVASPDVAIELDEEHDRYCWAELDVAVARCKPASVARSFAAVDRWLQSRSS